MKKIITLAIALALVTLTVNAQEKINVPQIGIEAPSFKAQSTNGTINFPKDMGNSWKILFSHPKDFTPVCSSEILELAFAQQDFKKLNTSLVVVSTDILEQHKSWKAALEEIDFHGRGKAKINFPIVADDSHEVVTLYGMVHSDGNLSHNIRGVYFIDPQNKVRAIQFYPNEVGRNTEELKRTLMALQKTDSQKNLVTPANWNPGDDVIVPVLSANEKAKIGSPDSDYYQLAWFLTYKKEK